MFLSFLLVTTLALILVFSNTERMLILRVSLYFTLMCISCSWKGGQNFWRGHHRGAACTIPIPMQWLFIIVMLTWTLNRLATAAYAVTCLGEERLANYGPNTTFNLERTQQYLFLLEGYFLDTWDQLLLQAVPFIELLQGVCVLLNISSVCMAVDTFVARAAFESVIVGVYFDQIEVILL